MVGDTWPAVQNDRTGSRLYLLRRSKLTNKTPQLARDYVREALAWMVEDGVASVLILTLSGPGQTRWHLPLPFTSVTAIFTTLFLMISGVN